MVTSMIINIDSSCTWSNSWSPFQGVHHWDPLFECYRRRFDELAALSKVILCPRAQFPFLLHMRARAIDSMSNTNLHGA
jgi:hypothetical protein